MSCRRGYYDFYDLTGLDDFNELPNSLIRSFPNLQSAITLLHAHL